MGYPAMALRHSAWVTQRMVYLAMGRRTNVFLLRTVTGPMGVERTAEVPGSVDIIAKRMAPMSLTPT